MFLSRKQNNQKTQNSPAKKQSPSGGDNRTASAGKSAAVGSDRIFKLVRVGIIAVLVFTAVQFAQQYSRYLNIMGETAYYNSVLVAEEEKRHNLEREKSLVYNDAYIERLARKTLGMIKAGETLVYPAKEADVLVLDKTQDASKYNH